MTYDDAVGEVVYLKGLFPKLTKEQVDFWLKRFLLRNDPVAVRRATERFADAHFEYVDPSGLLALINSEESRKVTCRTADEIRAERAAADTHWADVDRALSGMTPEALDRLKATALAEMKPDARAWLERRDPANCRTLRAVLYTHHTKRAATNRVA